MGNVKEISILFKSHILFFLKTWSKSKSFNSNLIKIDKKSYKNIDIYYIGYVTIKSISDYENIHSVYPLYPIIGKSDGYKEESNGNKYLVFASKDKKEVLTKCTELWNGIKNLIKTVNGGEAGEYDTVSGKLCLNQVIIWKLHMLTVIVRSVFEEDGKYYPQKFLDQRLYEL